MQSHIDCQGTERDHGYTKDDTGEIWYWSIPKRGTEVEFTDRGCHIDHPIRRTGEVPDEIREHAETHVSALIEQAEDPQY